MPVADVVEPLTRSAMLIKSVFTFFMLLLLRGSSFLVQSSVRQCCSPQHHAANLTLKDDIYYCGNPEVENSVEKVNLTCLEDEKVVFIAYEKDDDEMFFADNQA